MNTKDIDKRLIDLELPKAALAREIGISRVMLYEVLAGRAETPWIRREIARRLGFTYEAVWGTPDPGLERGEYVRRGRGNTLHPSSVAPNEARGDR